MENIENKEIVQNTEVEKNDETVLANGMTRKEWARELDRIRMIKRKNGELYDTF